MRVQLKDIHPNPFRYINRGYPINKLKVERLRSSIKRTGFWDNLIARKKDGKIEIAYGHHRIEALRQEFKPDYEIDIVIRDLDDATMLKIMASENDSIDVISPGVINETVRAAMKFLKRGEIKDVSAGAKETLRYRRSKEVLTIAKFLDWPTERVQGAINAIHAINEGEIDKDEYESLPNQTIATEYRQAVKLTPLPKEARLKIVDQIKKHEIGKRQVKHEFLKAKFERTPSKQKEIMLDDVAKSLAQSLRNASVLVTPKVIENAEYFSKDAIRDLAQAYKMFSAKLKSIEGRLAKGQVLLLE